LKRQHLLCLLLPWLLTGGGNVPGAPGTPGGAPLDLSSVTQLIQSVTKSGQAQQQAQLFGNTLIGSLNQLKLQLPYIRSDQQGMAIYQALVNVMTQISGQAVNLSSFSSQQPSVDVVRQQITDIQNFVTSKQQYLQQMTAQQSQAYVIALQQANMTITNATAASIVQPNQGGMMPGGYGGMQGGYGGMPGGMPPGPGPGYGGGGYGGGMPGGYGMQGGPGGYGMPARF